MRRAPQSVYCFLILFFVSLQCRTVQGAGRAASSSSPALPPPSIFYQFPKGKGIENFTVRPNGQLLVTLATDPEIYQVDPYHNQTGFVLHRFEGYGSALGTAETQPDLFYVITGNYSTAKVAGTKGTFSIWEVDLRKHDEPPCVSKVVDIPDAVALDGMATVNTHKGLIITGDSATGVLYLIDTKAKEVSHVFESPLLNRTSASTEGIGALGINGIKVRGDNLYFTNFAQNFFGRLSLDTHTGVPSGTPKVVYNASTLLDDFTFNDKGDLFFTEDYFGVYFFSKQGLNAPVGVIEQPRLLVNYSGSDACRFGRGKRDRHDLYFTAIDVDPHPSVVGKIDLTGVSLG